MTLPSDGLTPELAARFDQLRQHFLAGLPRRMDEIAAAPDTPTLEAALHRLAGTSGAYGFATLGAFAREAMQASSMGNAADLSAGMARLHAEYQRISSATGTVPPL